MKTYKEMTENILKRRDEYNEALKKRHKKAIIFASAAAGIALTAFAGTMLFKENKPDIITQPPATSEVQNSSNNSAAQTTITEPPVTEQVIIEQPEKQPYQNTIVINKYDESVSSDMYISLMLDDFVEMSRNEVCEYYGTNVFPEVPSDLVCWDEFKGHRYGIYKREKGKGEIYHDQNDITYSNDDVSKSINIKVARGKFPFICCMYLMKDEMKASEINGIEVYIGQDTDMTEVYYAEFMYNNTGFYVFTDGLTEDETVAVISSLIQ